MATSPGAYPLLVSVSCLLAPVPYEGKPPIEGVLAPTERKIKHLTGSFSPEKPNLCRKFDQRIDAKSVELDPLQLHAWD